MESSIVEYFNDLPDEALIELIETSWEALEVLCMLMSVDIHLEKIPNLKMVN